MGVLRGLASLVGQEPDRPCSASHCSNAPGVAVISLHLRQFLLQASLCNLQVWIRWHQTKDSGLKYWALVTFTMSLASKLLTFAFRRDQSMVD